MNSFFNKLRSYVILVFFVSLIVIKSDAQNLTINEIQSSNISTLYDHTGDTPDWIEIYNSGAVKINLLNYGLSDVDSLPLKWVFPSVTLPPKRYLLVHASGLNLKEPSLYWETIVDVGDEWKYLLPTTELDDSWKSTGFNDTIWSVGKSGFGYGDDDDSTIIESTISLFIRKSISITNLNEIDQAYLHMDFDDAFVAYLNGKEIARSNIGKIGTPPAFDQKANNYDHEAKLYRGGQPDEFLIKSVNDYLVEGENILAIQIHNNAVTSSDMTAIPIFSLGREIRPNYEVSISPFISLIPIGLHTNFKISTKGESIILSSPEGNQIDSVFSSNISADHSAGRKPDGGSTWVFFDTPTPWLSNITIGYANASPEKVLFSKLGGLYQGDIIINLSGNDPTDSIFYTLDGSDPDENDSSYHSQIELFQTTTIKARVINSFQLPGIIATNTYLINESHNLPIVSVTTNPKNLWDEEYGIYVKGNNASSEFPYKGANFWEDWERPANIAMYEQDGKLAFQIDAGIKIFGNYSRGNNQKSLSIHARKSYGYDGIKYKIFEEKDIDEFKTIILRNSGNDFAKTMFRDAFANRLAFSLELDHQAYRPAVVYINGEYWGIQNIREKVNEEFIAANHGVDENLIDILEFNGTVVKGNSEHYKSLLAYLGTHDLSITENYNYVAEQIDVENYIKYQMINIFIDNQDWPGNNIKYWRERSPNGKWRWILFDLDAAFSTWFPDNKSYNTLEYALKSDGPGWPNPPWSTYLFRKMMENPSFKNDFINVFADNLNTIFKPSVLKATLDEMKAVIKSEMPNHLKRWGNQTMDYWANRIKTIEDFIKDRQRFVRTHILRQFKLSGTYNLQLNVIDNGTIKLNSLKVDDFPWNGTYFNQIPIKIDAIPNPGYKFDKWEDINTTYREKLVIDSDSSITIRAVFVPYAEKKDQIIINEINYNSDEDFDSGDWVELLNLSDNSINISGWILKDGDDEHGFVFPDGTIIESKGLLTVSKNHQKFSAIFPAVDLVEGEMDFGFRSGGECIRLFTTNDLLMNKVCYESADPWPLQPNGNGSSLALLNTLGNNSHPANWEASINHGTPGTINKDIITAIGEEQYFDNSYFINVYPNPLKRITNIKISSQFQEVMSMMLIDMTGRKLSETKEYYLSKGGNRITLNLDDFAQGLSSGIYIIMLESEHVQERIKIIVKD